MTTRTVQHRCPHRPPDPVDRAGRDGAPARPDRAAGCAGRSSGCASSASRSTTSTARTSRSRCRRSPRSSHFSHTVEGLILGAFFWTYALFQLPAGHFIDRLGARVTYAFAVIWWSVFTALSAVATGAASLFGFRLGLGDRRERVVPGQREGGQQVVPEAGAGVRHQHLRQRRPVRQRGGAAGGGRPRRVAGLAGLVRGHRRARPRVGARPGSSGTATRVRSAASARTSWPTSRRAAPAASTTRTARSRGCTRRRRCAGASCSPTARCGG